MKTRTFLSVLKFVVLSLLVGYVSSLLQRESMSTWYPFLNKSSLTPPGSVFAVVWGVLYILMGVSAGLVWGRRTSASWMLLIMFLLQLFLNLLWSFCFFYMQLPLLALVVLLALFLTVAAYVVGCYGQNRLAAFLNVPYMLWLLFATYLNGYVVVFN